MPGLLGEEKSEREIGWVVGFYCGEGTASAHRNTSGRYYLNISVGNTDLESLERCQHVIGGKVYGPYKPRGPLGKKLYYTLKIDSQEEARGALAIMWDGLSAEKREQAQRVLEKVEANPPVTPHKERWKTRVERHGETGGNRPRTLVPVVCKRQHALAERYEYTNPEGRTMFKCRACQRERDQERRAVKGREKRVATG